MPIVNLNQMLQKAIKGKYAVLHVNVINYDMAKTAILAANETSSPLIVAVSQKALDNCFEGVEDFAQMVKAIVNHEEISVPIAILLDHGKYETVLEAIDAGFSAVMYDGSKLPLKDNLAKTKFVVDKAKSKKVSVECEVGAITGKVEDKGAPVQLATIEECKEMVATGIDCLAAGIGNLHGNYPQD
jgi:fructose-bisphosphate aldolase class II